MENARIVTVRGRAQLLLPPDVAFINFNVVSSSADISASQAENAKIVAQFRNDIAKLGINEGDIVTSSYNLAPQYEYKDNKKKLVCYNTSCSLRVRVCRLEMVGAVIDKAGENLVGRIDSIEFTLANKEEIYNNALVDALKNAKEKAELLARAEGLSIEKLISVEEAAQNDFQAPLVARAFAAESVQTQISSGSIAIKAEVEAVYLLR